MYQIAWSPEGICAPIELIAVLVNAGPITERQWWEALSDRVTKMAMHEDPALTLWACRALGTDVGCTDNPREAGQYLVEGNLNLRTHLTLAAYDGDPFPAIAAEQQEAREAIEACDLEMWVDLARSMTS